MGLNLSRGPASKYYSSDRVVQLFGNGLLTFIDKKTQFNDFLPKNSFIGYQDINDLSFEINKYKKDDKERRKIAKNGRDFYLRYINSTLVAEFILSKTLDIKSKNNFVWER
jgi:spore maturation protein CgeB